MRGKAVGKDRHGPTRRPDDDGPDSSAWLTTYGDAVTLLLAFFVMLFAMSSTDVAKFEQMAQSMRAAFDGSEGILPENTSVALDPRDITDPGPPDTASMPEPPASDGVLAEELHDLLADEGLLDIADVVRAPGEVVIRVRTDEVLFATGSSDLRPPARRLLGALAPTLASLPNDIRIEGHTDDVPINRHDYTNWDLSADRAVAVVKLLTDEHGTDPLRLSAVGFGEFAPLVPNDSAEHRSANRRVEIVIETHDDADVVRTEEPDAA